jgi:hypothetical protein
MAKKEQTSKTELQTSAKNLPSVVSQNPILALLDKHGADDALKAQVSEVVENLNLIENPTLPRLKVSAAGLVPHEGADPVEEMNVIILYGKKYNSYYKKAYKPGSKERPDCFSSDGRLPDTSIEQPQNGKCDGCKQSAWGTNAMGVGKACRNLRRLFVLTEDDNIMPMLLSITPTSLKEFDSYLSKLVMKGLNQGKVRTKIKARRDSDEATFARLSFEMVEPIKDTALLARVNVLKNIWLPQMDAQAITEEDLGEGPQSEPAASVSPRGEF